MKDIITDIDKLSVRSDELDTRKKNKLIQGIVFELKERVKKDNLKGLSAIQLGYPYRIFVINFNGNIQAYVNPIVTNTSSFTFSKETCSSIPGKTYIMPRFGKISLTYMDPLGRVKSNEFIGMAAFTVAHHIDHLEGVLVSDIGLEIDDSFENASEEDKNELLKAYMESLDIKAKELNEEIESDINLKNLKDSIDFIESVQRGDTKLDGKQTVEKKLDE